MEKQVAKLINDQINFEFYSSYLYLDLANYYGRVGLDGFENYFKIQAKEELDHAILLYQYLQNNDEVVTFEPVKKPEWTPDSHKTPLEISFAHEKHITTLINGIYAAANEVHDFRTMQVLDWFVKEQGEEEKNASDLVTKMDLYGSDAKGLYMLNSELAGRTYTAPSLVL